VLAFLTDFPFCLPRISISIDPLATKETWKRQAVKRKTIKKCNQKCMFSPFVFCFSFLFQTPLNNDLFINL